ncbi:MAG TPA: AAA family ATPase, partial [Janthinobacterium sp.]|nr:AAA family ATPase [Janthinobacterium sp.]
MKIVIISPSRAHLAEMGALLESPAHSVLLVEGGLGRMRQVAEQEHPELLLVEGMCCDPRELGQVEYLGNRYPALAVILLCASHPPEFLLHAMRAGVREVLPSPAPAAALEAAVGRAASRLVGGQARPRGRVLAFLPCKGGVGATFLASNLGYQLSQSASVLLLDLNLQFGDALTFLHDAAPASTLAELAHDIGRLDADFLAASCVKVTPSYAILAAPEDPALALAIRPEHIDAILSVAADAYDFILLDMSRSLDPLSIRALDRADRIYLVLQAALSSLRSASKLMTAFKSLGYPA